MSSAQGIRAAHAALQAAGPRGLPMRLLVAIVMHVGQVGEGTAYMALRARIAWQEQYRAESRARWAGVSVKGRRLDEQVWRVTT